MQRPALTHVSTYLRRVPVAVERVWENVRDWEHLPHLHASSFRSIALEAAGDWGWRARIGLHPSSEILLELCIDAPGTRYVSRTLEGPGMGSEIWTTLAPTTPQHTGIAVEFWIPGIAPERIDAVGAIYRDLYATLWDEDEAMMVRRAREVARQMTPRAAPATLSLGREAELRARLPLCVEWAGRPWRIVESGGELVVYSTTCPHWLGPLDACETEAGVVTCPWHGWRFDLKSGRARDGRPARLAPPPQIERDREGNAWLAAPPER